MGIKVSNRNLCLCAPSYSNGVLLRFYTCGQCPQSGGDQWIIGGPGSAGEIKASWHSSSCVDVKDGHINNGADIQLWQCFGNPQQQWVRFTMAEGNKTESHVVV